MIYLNPLFILIGFIILVVLFFWSLYNGLVTAKLRVKEAWSQIDVQLKRRVNLIPNLVETVKGYAKHEKTIFENVTKARSTLLSAPGPKDKADANNQLVGALKSLFAVAENYPDLKASQNFLALQRELEDAEDKIAYARQFYNTAVLEYNTKIKLFPNVLLSQSMGFTEEEFFEAKADEREKINVKFD